MTELERLKEEIMEEAFQREPLAQAVMIALSQNGIISSEDVLKIFDELMNQKFDVLIKRSVENDLASVPSEND